MESEADPTGLSADIWWPLISQQLNPFGDRESKELGAVDDSVRAILGRLRFDALTAFEFSLSSKSEQAFLPDISQKIERPEQADLILESWRSHPEPWKNLLKTWADFVRRRQHGQADSVDINDFLSAVESVWLEFDLARMTASGSPTEAGFSPEPHPVLCLTLPRYRCDLNMASGLSLFGGEDRGAQATTLSRCMEKLPEICAFPSRIGSLMFGAWVNLSSRMIAMVGCPRLGLVGGTGSIGFKSS